MKRTPTLIMKLSVFLLFLLALSISCNVDRIRPIKSNHFEMIALGDGIYSCVHKFGGKAICNVGVVDNGTETIIFDSFLSPDVAEELLRAIEHMGLSPVKYVVNSHYHNDHIRGNQVFSKDVRIISTTKTMELIREQEPLQIAYEKENAPARFSYYDSLFHAFNGDEQSRDYQQILMWRPYYQILSNSHLEVQTRLPDVLVDSTMNIDGPQRKIRLITKGEGHTESDLVLYLPEDGILFTGDLVFNECHPYVPHGNVSKWKAWLDFLKSLNVNTVMPGHGKVGTDVLIDQMKLYLEDLELAANNLLENNLVIADLESIVVPDKYKNWWFDRFYEYNLTFVFESMKTE